MSSLFSRIFETFFLPPCQDREDVEEGGAVQAVQIIHYQASQLFALGCDVHGCCLLVQPKKIKEKNRIDPHSTSTDDIHVNILTPHYMYIVHCTTSFCKFLSLAEPEFVNILRSPGIDFQPDGIYSWAL